MALPQPLHIFRKDILHLWPETAASVVLIAAFAWAAPSGWAQSQYAQAAVLLAGFLKVFLIPISWLVMISRLIHDEPLVGDRQFWTSRPYHWGNLLAAKVLYLLVFLYLPFFLMQVYLLKHAGLYPTTVIPALLHNLLLLTVVVVIPLAAIAAVTATFARMLLTTIGAVVYMLVVMLAVLYLVIRRMPPPGIEYILYTIVILLPAAILVYQYATRKTQNARIALAATPLLVVFLLFLTPANALILHYFPVASGKDAPKLSGLPDGVLPKVAPPGKLRVDHDQVFVAIPVAVGGVDQKSSYVVRGLSATIAGSGVRWSSPYLNQIGKEIGAFSPFARMDIPVPLAVFNKISKAPADVHLSLAVEHVSADEPSRWKATLLPFAVPGHGLCSFPQDDTAAPPTCRYAFKTPELNFASAMLAAGSCTQPAAPPTQGRMRVGLGSTGLDFDPVVTVPLTFQTADPNPQHHYLLCPGTEISFLEAKQLGKSRLEVDEHGLLLDPLAERQQERSEVGPEGPGGPEAPEGAQPMPQPRRQP